MTKNLNVSLVVIGDEILNGRTSDLNGKFIAKFLFSKGMELVSMRFIRDNEDEIVAALDAAFKDASIVITSGGIGPTLDDKTKNVMAKYFNQKLIEREDIAQLVSDNYIRFGRTWSKELNHYHIFPENFEGIKNPKGLAPGLLYFDQKNKKLLLSGPGVPRELSAMSEQEFYPAIIKYFPNDFEENQQVVIRTKEVPEEKIFNQLCPNLWSDLSQFGKVSSLPHTIGIDIVVTFKGNQELKLKHEKEIRKIIESSAIKDNVWQYGNENLPELSKQIAIAKKLKFGFAESCTGGLTSSKITDLAGSSEVFYGSIISYDNSIKESQLNVSSDILKNHGAVSVECAKAMAKGALEKLKVDVAVSITGIAGPTGGSAEKPIGTVVIGFATKNKNEAFSFQFPGDRIRLKERFSDRALLMLYEVMRDQF